MNKIDEVLNKTYNNHFFPFLWMHGEDKKTIKEYLEKISETGIDVVCLESRPYENFLEKQWWEDLSFIIQQCKTLGMKVWILDDKHFPTGYAAGRIQKEYPHLQKEFLAINSLDFVGPKEDAEIIVDWLTKERANIMNVGTETAILKSDKKIEKSEIVCIYAAKKINYDEVDEDSIIKLNWNSDDCTIFWNVPNGEWRLFVIYKTKNGGEKATEGYLNPLVKEATQVLIETVYESHYRHFKNEFGKTILGFFSDEPRFGNVKGPDAIIGEKEMPLPWCNQLEEELAKRLKINKDEVLSHLLLLFVGKSNKAKELQYQYMQIISQLFSENFSNVIGKWCEEHNVEYIGHVIEDNNAHARLGYGAGHFFRSMSGQHMAGLDIVLHQLVPGQNNGFFKSYTSAGWDGEFFTYGLAKLGSSLGQLDPLKKGRTMCEVYGAYGWSEGLRLMKWISDHMMVNGVNYFVPHAFTMKKFPDIDCPPHFYAHGNNPEFPYMKNLIEYCNRLSTLLSGGQYKCSVGILYHAEAEWSGDCMFFQKPARKLSENQIGFSIISGDMIIDQMAFDSGKFIINQMDFTTLIIPYAKKLPHKLLIQLIQMAENGVKIIFIDDYPCAICENIEDKEIMNKVIDHCCVCKLDNLIENLDDTDKLSTSEHVSYLRYYHYIQGNQDIFMLFNEDMNHKIDMNITFPINKELYIYDPLDNCLRYPIVTENEYKLTLDKGETVIYISDIKDNQLVFEPKEWKECQNLKYQPWSVVVNSGFGMPSQKKWDFNELPALTKMKEFRDFSGELIYQTSISSSELNLMLNITNVSEIVTVYVNEKKVATRFSYPYKFDLSGFLNQDENILKISVINNLGRYMKDYLSQYLFLDPVGITGEVLLLKPLD